MIVLNLKLTSVYIIGGLMVVATSSRALTGVAPANVHLAAAANPASTSDGNGDNSNPYAIIIDRNIFRLNPPPPPPVAAVKPVDVPKVYLNGILKNGDDVRVLFSIPPKDGKSQTSYFKLAPGETASGEKEDVLELVRIHPDQQEVDVVVNGTAETLSVLSNSLASAGGNAGGGAKSAPAPAPAALIANAPSSVVVGGDRSASRYGGGGGGGGGVTVIGGGSSSSLGGGSGGTGWQWQRWQPHSLWWRSISFRRQRCGAANSKCSNVRHAKPGANWEYSNRTGSSSGTADAGLAPRPYKESQRSATTAATGGNGGRKYRDHATHPWGTW